MPLKGVHKYKGCLTKLGQTVFLKSLATGENVIRQNEMVWNEACLRINFIYFYASEKWNCTKLHFYKNTMFLTALIDTTFHFLGKSIQVPIYIYIYIYMQHNIIDLKEVRAIINLRTILYYILNIFSFFPLYCRTYEFYTYT